MKSKTIRGYKTSCLAALFMLSSCADLGILTYPIDFTWIGQEHLKTVMHEMANSISKLNTVQKDDINPVEKQQLVLQELDRIESYAMTLSDEYEWPTEESKNMQANHLSFNENITEFINVVGEARLEVEANPAVYLGIRRVTDRCTECHRLR